jgi:dihydroorotate dehydrogenase electron transfer subunit
VTVCLGARGLEDLLLVDAFERLGCGLILTTEDGSCGEQGLITQPISRLAAAHSLDTLYACGPAGMLSALAALCSEHKVDYQLSWEAKMRCGMGLCGSCEVPQSQDVNLPVGWLACFDGPVFRQTWQ